MAKQAGASLNPADMSTGGNIDDGRYVITAAQVILMDTNRGEKCAVEFVLRDKSGTDQAQRYTIGPSDKFQPSEDGNEIITEAKISKKSNLGKFLKAVADAGFPGNEMSSSVQCFVSADIDITNVAQPKQEGDTDDKSLPLPTKYHGKAKVGQKGRPTTSGTAKGVSKSTPAPSSAATNGDLDADAIMRVQEALTGAKDNTLNRVKLQLTVWQLATKAKDANATEYRKLAGNVEWLEANSETGSWMVDGDNVTLAS